MFCRWLFFSVLVCSSACAIENNENTVSVLYQEWLTLQVDGQLPQLAVLAEQAQSLTEQNPSVAECWALQGMIKAQQANLTSGLEGLKLAEQAKDMLQKALSIDPYVFYGVAYAELGWLYHRTPGWPFSFGSDKMAIRLFEKALKINPRSVAANSRYAEYWSDKENDSQAEVFLQATLVAIKLHSPTELYNLAWIEYKRQIADQKLEEIHSRNKQINDLTVSN